MIAALKPYQKYKASGLPWLGEIPAHWETRRAKYLFREIDERSQTGKEGVPQVMTAILPDRSRLLFMPLFALAIGQIQPHTHQLTENRRQLLSIRFR